ncbi:hypothetical protein [Nocardia sp. NPDC051832]|uniref:hypothetical protein n=1 Tax=Nocardia sp. NPDC051832 TaxID=3155673 RepID=UPI0034284A2D
MDAFAVVVAVAHDLGDFGEAGNAAVEQDDYLAVVFVEEGEEVSADDTVDNFCFGPLERDGRSVRRRAL